MEQDPSSDGWFAWRLVNGEWVRDDTEPTWRSSAPTWWTRHVVGRWDDFRIWWRNRRLQPPTDH